MADPETAEFAERERLRQRLYVALVEQRVIDSQKFGEAPYAPITWDDVDRVIPPGWNPTPPEGGYTAKDF